MDNKVWVKKIIYKLDTSISQRKSRIQKLNEMIRLEENFIEDEQKKISDLKGNIHNLSDDFLEDI